MVESVGDEDFFLVSFDRVEVFEFDYIEKNLELKISGGRRYNFRPQSGNPDDLLVFQQQVTAARQRLFPERNAHFR